MRKWIPLVGVLSLVVGLAVTWRSCGQSDGTPAWKQLLADHPVPPLDGHVPYNNYELRRHLWNDVLLQETWDADVGRELAALIAALPDDFMFRDDSPLELIRAHRSANETVDVMVARLRSGAPIDDESREIIIEAMLAYSKKADLFARLHATQVLVYSELVEDPRVRRRLEQMRSDHHPDVAANAKRQLNAYLDRKARDGHE